MQAKSNKTFQKMKPFYIFTLLLFLVNSKIQAQFSNERPKLVVGIVVDQMRYDYLIRYHSKYSEGGFKKLMNQGFNCRNGHYNYVPTETAPGHASIYTGTTPAFHGIVANEWFEKGKSRYCVEDSTVSPVGSQSPNGARSPRNMIAPTIGDQLKLATNGQSKVFGVSIKDRGAILPAGHTANGAFWYDNLTGKFITSSFYMQALPQWLQKFNEQKNSDKYLTMQWETLLPISQYTESQADDNKYEQLLAGKEKPTFPYNLKEISTKMASGQFKQSPYEVIPYTPYGNTLVKDMAKEIITQEKLGKGNSTDLLAVSFSSTDLIGHAFGPQSIEVEDTYLRLDKDLEDLLAHLDKEVGKGNYVLFLSADHAGVYTPKYLTDLKIPSGYTKTKEHYKNLAAHLNKTFGEGKWIEHTADKEVYLNRTFIESKKANLAEIQEVVAAFMRNCEGIFEAITQNDLNKTEYTKGIKAMVQNANYHLRSPDVTIVHRSGWLDASWLKGGTSHGTPYNYDTQVPMLFYGWKIPQGKNTVRKVSITDIAATIATLLNMQLPDASNGEPIKEIFGE